jgi:AcrR family transcriptional regulator
MEGSRAPEQALGLRERKKQRMRALIADTARRLFLEHGFEATTVAQVAREADVAQQTVFNYFPTKEDLFYSGMETFEEELLDAVRGREPGESALGAFGRFVLEPRGVFASEDADPADATRQLRAITRVITESPALLAREREIFTRYTQALAKLLADETDADPDSLEPYVAAHAMIGVHRSAIDYVRLRTLAGARVPELAPEARARTRQAVAFLAHGLGDYAVRA